MYSFIIITIIVIISSRQYDKILYYLMSKITQWLFCLCFEKKVELDYERSSLFEVRVNPEVYHNSLAYVGETVNLTIDTDPCDDQCKQKERGQYLS